MTELKRCARCQQIKKESQFRYIKYFQKRRSICKRCEAVERQGRKRAVEKHVREHGVTPGILERIQRETNGQAEKQARVMILNKLSQATRIRYHVSKVILPLCYFVLFVLIVPSLLVLWVLITKGVSSDFFEIFLALGVAAIITAILYRPVHSVDRQISTQYASIREHVFREILLKRIEYEQFYRSAEWQILRLSFLRTRKRTQGSYICDFCRNTIWRSRDITVDHIKPRSKFPGLAMSLDNLLLACRRCNSSKGNKLLSEEEFNALLARSKGINT
jgi:5-methylcytosine-specific restriction endonuclease McrA